MKILFVTPGLNPPHGGYRIIFEVATRLGAAGHEVAIHSLDRDTTCPWYKLSVPLQPEYKPEGFDILVLCSPHSIDLVGRIDCPPRVVLFCQMLEHLFKPHDAAWRKKCEEFYRSRHPVICTASWNLREIAKYKPSNAKSYVVGQGVNLEHFPIDCSPKDGTTVLVEGWESSNPAKDTDHIGPKVAKRLKAEGYHIIGYSAKPLRTMSEAVDEYHQAPSLKVLNDLYKRATILLKATKYDARALSPQEAMTKGTVTARAIVEGDDDLVDQVTCLRVGYHEEFLYRAAKKLLTQTALRQQLSEKCLAYVESRDWDYWMPKYIDAIVGKEERSRSVIVSVVYDEPEWKQTKKCVESAGVPVVYAVRNPKGVGSLAEAINRGIAQAIQQHPEAEFAWVVTNVTFSTGTLGGLEAAMDANPGFAAIHPAFHSDHAFCQPIKGFSGVTSVPFVEFTAPIIRIEDFKRIGPLDERAPYWGHDLIWGRTARELLYSIGVDHSTTIGHVYIRNNKSGNDVTNRRKNLRKQSDKATRERLEELYGETWKVTTGYAID